jgi:hypothetical protein
MPRSAYAWEWLRRRSEYVEAWSVMPNAGSADARKWGLHEFEDPNVDARSARPIWTREVVRLVLEAGAERCLPGTDALDIARYAHLAHMVEDGVRQRLLLSDGAHSIRLDIAGAAVLDGPVRLHYRLQGMASLAGPLLTLRRLQHFAIRHRFSRALDPAEPRWRRMILLLRACDGMSEGATQRDLAALLLDPASSDSRWRVEQPSVRSRAQRLAHGARSIAAGGFWRLLR